MSEFQNNKEWLKSHCNRYVNGICTTFSCLWRGGYRRRGPYDPEIATCPAHEILCKLEQHERAVSDHCMIDADS